VCIPEGYRLIQHVMLVIDYGGDAELENQLALANEILDEIRAGKDFLEAAIEYGADQGMSHPRVGKGYPITAGVTGYGPEFEAAAMALAHPGDISAEPLVSADDSGNPFAVHILRYAEDLIPGEIPFDECKDEYMTALLQERKSALASEIRSEWWEAAGVSVDTSGLVAYYEAKAAEAAATQPEENAQATPVPAPAPVEPALSYGLVIGDETPLFDLPEGTALLKLDAGVSLTVEGFTETGDGALWAFVTLPEGAGQGFVMLEALELVGADLLTPVPEGVHPQTVDAEGKRPVFTVVMQDGGLIYGELYPDMAPISVGNFAELANSGFYSGVIFHRVIPGFMIQGGDPQGTGMGGPGHSIKGEFANNGVANSLSHTRGALSMARTSEPDSAGSQFFICVQDSLFLDGEYAAFGMVLGGMETADRIAAVACDTGDKPFEPQEIRTIHVQTYGADYPFDKLPSR